MNCAAPDPFSGENDPGPPQLQLPLANCDPSVPLFNLSILRSRIDSVRCLISRSLDSASLVSDHQIDLVSLEISSSVQQIILNGAALIASSQNHLLPRPPGPARHPSDAGASRPQEEEPRAAAPPAASDGEIVELDSVELLAEHVHFCEICGKGFKRDANLRMHMRAHGNRFKTVEALSKPDRDRGGEDDSDRKRMRFSCPFPGCNRNQSHRRFRPLKSAVCVKNHFKRSHCPKMYFCNRCNKKSFSVVSDLKSHLKHCGESRWRCSCGTSFSRKDKLFGHVALFEGGHMPAVAADERSAVAMGVGGELQAEEGAGVLDPGFLEGLLEGFDPIGGASFDDLVGLL